jgi:hypothetical protein
MIQEMPDVYLKIKDHDGNQGFYPVRDTYQI